MSLYKPGSLHKDLYPGCSEKSSMMIIHVDEQGIQPMTPPSQQGGGLQPLLGKKHCLHTDMSKNISNVSGSFTPMVTIPVSLCNVCPQAAASCCPQAAQQACPAPTLVLTRGCFHTGCTGHVPPCRFPTVQGQMSHSSNPTERTHCLQPPCHLGLQCLGSRFP